MASFHLIAVLDAFLPLANLCEWFIYPLPRGRRRRFMRLTHSSGKVYLQAFVAQLNPAKGLVPALDAGRKKDLACH